MSHPNITYPVFALAVVGASCSSSAKSATPTEGPAPTARDAASPARAVHVDCERGPGMGRGGMGRGPGGMGPGMAGGMGPGAAGMEDMQQIHQLLAGHDAIERKVVERIDGIESWTTSDDAAIAAALPMHVEAMTQRMESGQLIHGFDPLFRGVFAEAQNIEVIVEPLPDGVHVIERGKTPEAVALIHAHAQVVSWFVANGMPEAHRCHDVAPSSYDQPTQ